MKPGTNLLVLFITLVLSSKHGLAKQDIESINIHIHNHVKPLIKTIQQHALQFKNGQPDYNALSNWIGDKQFVLIGDSTHGTREFYTIRAHITQYLIQHKQFNTVLIEGNWPGGYRINRYINHQLVSNHKQVLEGFKQILPWVWRNQQTKEFIQWLRQFNATRKPPQNIQFAGMDLFSLFPSKEKVIQYLLHHGNSGSEHLANLMQCFDQHQQSFYEYGATVTLNPELSCRKHVDQVVKQLLKQTFPDTTKVLKEALFNARINALTMQAAEQFISSAHQALSRQAWNSRENFMFSIIQQILKHHPSPNPKLVIWAHNTHVGDSRAFLGDNRFNLSLGQLLREKYSENAVFLLGSMAYKGRVLSSHVWNDSPLCMKLPKAAPPSFAWQFHQSKISKLIMKTDHLSKHGINSSNLPGYLRLVGVVYNPDEEIESNYFLVNLNQMFDAVMFVDSTRATQPLDFTCSNTH